MPPTILGKTFNLAGALRRGVVGIMVGLLVAGGADYFLKSDSITIFIVILAVVTLAFAIWGATEPQIARNSKAMKGWLKASRGLALMGMLGGRPAGADAVIPEKMTIGKFLWWLCFIFNLIALAFLLPAHIRISSDYLLFLVLLVIGVVLYFIRSLSLSFLISLTLLIIWIFF